jgi:hypothetical protein
LHNFFGVDACVLVVVLALCSEALVSPCAWLRAALPLRSLRVTRSAVCYDIFDILGRAQQYLMRVSVELTVSRGGGYA